MTSPDSRTEEEGGFHQEKAPNEAQEQEIDTAQELPGDEAEGFPDGSQTLTTHDAQQSDSAPGEKPQAHENLGQDTVNYQSGEKGDEFPISDTEILQRMIDYDAERGVLPTHNQISMCFFVNIWLRSEVPHSRVRQRIEKLANDYVMGRLSDPEQIKLCYTIWGPQDTVYANWTYKWSFFHRYHQHYAYWYNWYF